MSKSAKKKLISATHNRLSIAEQTVGAPYFVYPYFVRFSVSEITKRGTYPALVYKNKRPLIWLGAPYFVRFSSSEITK